jgi:hypothetical protein
MKLELVQETTAQACQVALHRTPGRSAAESAAQWADEATASAPWLTPVTYHAIDVDEAPDRPRFDCRKVLVRLTVMGAGDAVLRATEGQLALNRTRVQRLVNEAIGQGGILSQEDLVFLLGMSLESVWEVFAYYGEQDDALPYRL